MSIKYFGDNYKQNLNYIHGKIRLLDKLHELLFPTNYKIL